MTEHTMPTKVKKQRLRFGLRTLFLLVTFLGIVAIPVTIKINRALQTRAGIAGAIGEVTRLNGSIEFDASGHVKRVCFVGGRPLNDLDLEALVPHLEKLPALKAIELHSDRV